MCCYSDLERARLVVYLVFQLPCFPTVKANALDCSFTCNRQIFLARKWICQLIPFHLSVLLGNLVYSHHKDTNISISTYRNKSKIIWQLSHMRRETIATRGFTFAMLKVVIVQLIFYHDHLAVEKLYKLKAILCFSHSDWSSLMHCVWDYFILENTCSLSNENWEFIVHWINIFPNNMTSVLDGDSPADVTQWEPVQYQTAVAITQWGVDLLVQGCYCFKQNNCLPCAEREKQPKCMWRVYCRLNNLFICLPYLGGS